MSTDIDLEVFVDMFDTAMNSENPAVKKCFNNLLLVVALAHTSDGTKNDIGPLRSLVNRVSALERNAELLPVGKGGGGSYGPIFGSPMISTTTTLPTWGGSSIAPTGALGIASRSTYPIH